MKGAFTSSDYQKTKSSSRVIHVDCESSSESSGKDGGVEDPSWLSCWGVLFSLTGKNRRSSAFTSDATSKQSTVYNICLVLNNLDQCFSGNRRKSLFKNETQRSKP